jgi:hypothetical protein
MASHNLENMENPTQPHEQRNEQPESVSIDVEPTETGPLLVAKTFPDIKIYDSIEEFNQNLPNTVTLLKTPSGNSVYLIGTAHFSQESQRDVAGKDSNQISVRSKFHSMIFF